MNSIIYICDHNYTIPTKASIKSLAEHCISKCRVYVVGVELDQEDRNEISGLANEFLEIKIVDVEDKYKNIGMKHSYVSSASLYKFQLPYILNDDVALYVDGDVLFKNEFEKIFSIDLGDYYIAAVRDMEAEVYGNWAVKMHHEKYFNSGVMLMNLKKMRENEIPDKLVEYKKKDNDSTFMDQNALNAVLGDNVKWISQKYNYMLGANLKFSKEEKCLFWNIDDDEYYKIQNEIAIFHLAGGEKPWKMLEAECFNEWSKYVDKKDILILTKQYIENSNYENQKKFEECDKKFAEMQQQLRGVVEQHNFLYRHTFWGRVVSPIGHKLFNKKKV